MAFASPSTSLLRSAVSHGSLMAAALRISTTTPLAHATTCTTHYSFNISTRHLHPSCHASPRQLGDANTNWIEILEEHETTKDTMPYVNNNAYLDLAKSDFNNCQTLHQQESESIQKWYHRNCDVRGFGLSDRTILLAYYIAAASVFEVEKSEERLSWTKTAILMEMITSFSKKQQLSREQKHTFVDEFEHSSNLKYSQRGRYQTSTLIWTLLRTLNQLSLGILTTRGRDIRQELHHAWLKWLRTWEEGGGIGRGDGELIVNTLNLCSDSEHEVLMSHCKYQQLSEVTGKVCDQLRLVQQQKVMEKNDYILLFRGFDIEGDTSMRIESGMEELVKLVLTKSSSDLPMLIKQNFLVVAKSFYYAAYCNPEAIDFHVAKVLFERVL